MGAVILAGIGTVIGTLLFGRNYKRRIAALEARDKDIHRSVVIHGNLYIGDNYYNAEDGKHHAAIEGRGEIVSPVPVIRGKASIGALSARAKIAKMKHPGSGRNKDRSTVIYNAHITIRDVPEAAWEYVVNGKPALSWVMERQCVRTDKASGIVSDANRYAIETVGDPRYPLYLFLRVVTVSLETMKIVHTLPELTME